MIRKSHFTGLAALITISVVLFVSQVHAQQFGADQLTMDFPNDSSFRVRFQPTAPAEVFLQVESSTDLVTWQPVAWRLANATNWNTLGVTYQIDSSGFVLISFPEIQSKQIIRVTQLSATDGDSDIDGIPDWLEEIVDAIPVGQDTDGDGVSDQIELLTSLNPEVDDWQDQQATEALFTTQLKVYTPVATAN